MLLTLTLKLKLRTNPSSNHPKKLKDELRISDLVSFLKVKYVQLRKFSSNFLI